MSACFMLSVRCFQLLSLTEAVDGEALVLDGESWHFSCIVSRRGWWESDSGELQETEICEGDSQRSVPFCENVIDIETWHLKEGCFVTALE